MRKGRRGFTLIELLVVVTLIGILALIALPKFTGTRKKAYRSQMQADLRTLVNSQEAYFDDAGRQSRGLRESADRLAAAICAGREHGCHPECGELSSRRSQRWADEVL